MADTPINERKFTDEEVREILKRAVTRAPSRALAKSEGLSLAELKVIGEEVGIDPARLEDAARAVAVSDGPRGNPIIGAPTVLNFERRIEGEFTPEDTPEILSLIRRTMGVQGEVNEIHGSLEWRAKGEAGSRYVTVFSKDGGTTIRGSANLNQLSVVTYLPAGIMAVFATVLGLVGSAEAGSMAGIIASLSVIPVLYPTLRAILRKVTRSESAKLQRVVNELARLKETHQ